jgi:hypothetical protein
MFNALTTDRVGRDAARDKPGQKKCFSTSKDPPYHILRSAVV